MASGRIPGPLGIGSHYVVTDKGTLALTNSPIPGPLRIDCDRTADKIRQEQLKIEIAADIGQMILDITGIIDPTPISDGTNALISLARGRWTDALISAVSIIPYIGDVSKLAKLPRYLASIQKSIRLARTDVKWAARLREIFVKLKKLLDDLFEAGADNLPDIPRKYLQQIRDEIDAFLNPGSLQVKSGGASSTTVKSSVGKTSGTGPGNKSPKSKKPKERSQSEKEVSGSKEKGDKVIGAKNVLDIPQGLSKGQFDKLSESVGSKAKELDLGDDIFVQGSRANGTAKATSDIDIAIRVPPEKFDDFLNNQSKLGKVNPGSAKARTRDHAIETGKIQAGEAGLSPLRKQLEKELGMEVDLSVIKAGGKFDNASQLPMNK